MACGALFAAVFRLEATATRFLSRVGAAVRTGWGDHCCHNDYHRSPRAPIVHTSLLAESSSGVEISTGVLVCNTSLKYLLPFITTI